MPRKKGYGKLADKITEENTDRVKEIMKDIKKAIE